MRSHSELVVIGAGPAGLAAAEAAAKHGVAVTVVDEQPRPGGQITRQPPAEFRVADWLPGRAYRAGKALLTRVAACPGIDWMPRTTVAGILFPEPAGDGARFSAVIDGPDGLRTLTAAQVLIAPGGYDMPVIFPGWNLPGVMAAGGIQAFVKSQRFIAGDRFVLAGSHPLQLLVADQLVQAGADVAGVFFAQPGSRALALLRAPRDALGNFGKLALAAAAWRRLVAAGVPVRFGQAVTEALGDRAVEAVRVAPLDREGRLLRDAAYTLGCDRLGICYGFLASSELARQAGAACRWDARRGGWIVRHDGWMQTDVPGLFVAGEITGVSGAEVAAAEGRLAGLGSALAFGRVSAESAAAAAEPVRRSLRRLNRFARMLAELSWPGEVLLDQLQTGDANLCKCEEITVSDFTRLIDENPHVSTASAAKLLTRAGMGYCQGRYCQFPLIRVLSASRGIPAADVGAFSARFPARPVHIADVLDAGE